MNSSLPQQTFCYVYINIGQYLMQLIINLLTVFSVWRYMSVKEHRTNLIFNIRIQRMELEHSDPQSMQAQQYQAQISHLQWLIVQMHSTMLFIKDRLKCMKRWTNALRIINVVI